MKTAIPVSAARVATQFGWLGRFLAIDQPASSALTRERMGWRPTHPLLIEDIEAGCYVD